jgi:vacuolar-type H+-ATPase subunit E/Vma4
MKPVEQGKAALISGIEADAHAEEQRLLADAQAQAAEKKKYAQQKIESILDEARSKAAEQAESIKRKAISGVELEIKRRNLQVRDSLIQDLMDRVEKRLAATIDEPDYRTVLTNWIVEAAIGLDAEAATVNASQRERPLIDTAMLEQARQAVLSKTGKSVTLTLSDAPPLKGQGVVLTSHDGRMAFNNQVRTRMLRKQRQMHKLIYDGLFASPREE